jgi:hypothetical protein
MKTRTLTLAFLLILLLNSCAPKQLMTSEKRIETIEEVTLFKPATAISLISKGEGNKAHFSDSLSTVANENVIMGIDRYLSNYFLINGIQLDSLLQEEVNNEIFQMSRMIQYQKKIVSIPFPPTIDSIMKTNNIDYALCVLHTGFSREKGNYGAQVAKGALTGLLTLGMYYTTPIKAVSDLTICILDRNNHNIAFHNKNTLQEKEPIEEENTNKQIKAIFDEYFIKE